MSNHIHLILQSETLHLSDIIRDFKKFTANQIIEYAQKSVHESSADWMLDKFKFNAAKHKRNSFYQVWTHDNHSEELLSTKFIEQKLNYIHQNPVRAGVVQYDYEYLYSSARNYANLTNEMEIDFI
jgi:REP element-mobilizing transposase RayT